MINLFIGDIKKERTLSCSSREKKIETMNNYIKHQLISSSSNHYLVQFCFFLIRKLTFYCHYFRFKLHFNLYKFFSLMLSDSMMNILLLTIGLLVFIQTIHSIPVQNTNNDDTVAEEDSDDYSLNTHGKRTFSNSDIPDGYVGIMLGKRAATHSFRFPGEAVLLGKRRLPYEAVLLGKRDLPNEAILLGKRRIPHEAVLLGKRDLPNEAILLGKRDLPNEAILLGKRDLPNEGILLGK